MWDLIVSVPDHCLSLYFVHQQTSILNIVAFTVFQAILEFVRGNMEPCR